MNRRTECGWFGTEYCEPEKDDVKLFRAWATGFWLGVVAATLGAVVGVWLAGGM